MPQAIWAGPGHRPANYEKIGRVYPEGSPCTGAISPAGFFDPDDIFSLPGPVGRWSLHSGAAGPSRNIIRSMGLGEAAASAL